MQREEIREMMEQTAKDDRAYIERQKKKSIIISKIATFCMLATVVCQFVLVFVILHDSDQRTFANLICVGIVLFSGGVNLIESRYRLGISLGRWEAALEQLELVVKKKAEKEAEDE